MSVIERTAVILRLAALLLCACACALAATAATAPTTSAAGPVIAPPTLLLDNAGRGAFSPQRRRVRIAFDAVIDDNNRHMAVFTSDDRGASRSCVTCGSAVPSGYVGMMDWLPDGKHLLVVAESERSQHRRFNHPSFGIDNDLWLVSLDGKRAERIWRSPHRGGGITGVRVDRAGRRIVFAERVPTGQQLPVALRRFGPWGEDVWAGWHLHVADFDPRRRGEAMLRNHRVLLPNGPGFYEPSGFDARGGIVYAHTAAGGRYSDDLWLLPREGATPRNLTANTASWEEHGRLTADGRRLLFASSRFQSELRYPGADNAELVTELFIGAVDAPAEQARRLTFFNAAPDGRGVPGAPASVRSVIGAVSLAPDGSRALVHVAPRDGSAPPQLWLVPLPPS